LAADMAELIVRLAGIAQDCIGVPRLNAAE
jgi:hypothetical protein